MQLIHLIVPVVFYIAFSLVSKMFLTLLGICMLLYYFFYLICVVLFDCDVALGLAEKFGKKISSLKGKVIFITGASSGIGEHTAIAFAKNGVKLVLAARRKDELERVKSTCVASSKGQLSANDVLVLPFDVLRFETHQQMWDSALRHFGKIDVLINNAGRSQRANWENIDLAVDKEMFDLNVFAVINFTRIAVRYFLQSKIEGHVAVTSSVAGIIGLPFSGTYTGTKHAIHGYFNSLRTEKMLEDISVSLLCPGPIFTNFLEHCFTENQGESYSQKSHAAGDNRMTAERCGHLCAIAIANKLSEAWMAVLPLIPLVYGSVYCPILYKMVVKIIGPKKFLKIRDNKEELQLPVTTNT